MQILEERVEQAVVANPDITVADTAVYQYVWGPEGSGSPILRDENLDPGDPGSDDDCTEDPGTGSQRLFYTFMPNYMVTAMVDTSGAVAERYVYDAYGTPTIYNPAMSSTVTESSSKKNPIRFSSYYYDGVKGASTEWASCLYHVGHRSYHPTLGRWIQKDPLVLTGPSGGYQDGMSLYAYCDSSPISRRDPTGLMSEEECRFRLELLDQAAGGPGKASGVYGGNAGCHGETVRRRIKELIVGIHAPEIREMIDRFRNENITLKDSIVLGPLELSAVQGLTVSQAIYYPRLPKLRMQFFIKASFTIKYGRSKCKNGGTQYYLSESWAGELGVHGYKGIGKKVGPKTRFTLPVLETMKECPDQKVSTSCSSGVKFTARASLISASCKYEFGKGWSCGGGIRLRYKNIASIRVTASGVYTCTRTELQGPKP